ncbi:MAG: GAF domain-containing protein [Alkalispirochaeta sp.]|jgi:GAF domain-containing protein
MKRSELLEACKKELERGKTRGVGLQLVCSLLHQKVPYYDWFGFYLAIPEKRLLVLGPYEGEPTDHLRIPYGRGICGQAAERLETFVIDDVGRQDNYLACSIHVRSEIVVPVFKDGQFVAEIDVDSHTPDAFGDDDRVFLEALAPLCASHIPDIGSFPEVGG